MRSASATSCHTLLMQTRISLVNWKVFWKVRTGAGHDALKEERPMPELGECSRQGLWGRRQVLAGGIVGALIGLLFPMPLSPQPA